MAQTKFISLVLFALILCQGFFSSEGRYLKAEGNRDQKETQILVKHEEHVHGDGITTNEATLMSPPSPTLPLTDDAAGTSPPGRGVDDFRPTAPGHSPGVGHSTHN
ncbi:hypothetical protein L6164_019927 [Bauhinia variegata]|uniref:Uncharacterized protein n=1 Tax=Bauhinia variegata TaxID=167791 RepID=A0ACB9MVD6_BAUVA|nr:hypothetical protein L6164_019927 [Bauhinia variegata]